MIDTLVSLPPLELPPILFERLLSYHWQKTVVSKLSSIFLTNSEFSFFPRTQFLGRDAWGKDKMYPSSSFICHPFLPLPDCYTFSSSGSGPPI